MQLLSCAISSLALCALVALSPFVSGCCATPAKPPTPEQGLRKIERQSGVVEGRLPNAPSKEGTLRKPANP